MDTEPALGGIIYLYPLRKSRESDWDELLHGALFFFRLNVEFLVHGAQVRKQKKKRILLRPGLLVQR